MIQKNVQDSGYDTRLVPQESILQKGLAAANVAADYFAMIASTCDFKARWYSCDAGIEMRGSGGERGSRLGSNQAGRQADMLACEIASAWLAGLYGMTQSAQGQHWQFQVSWRTRAVYHRLCYMFSTSAAGRRSAFHLKLNRTAFTWSTQYSPAALSNSHGLGFHAVALAPGASDGVYYL